MIKAKIEFNAAEHKRGAKAIRLHRAKSRKRLERMGKKKKNSRRLERNIISAYSLSKVRACLIARRFHETLMCWRPVQLTDYRDGSLTASKGVIKNFPERFLLLFIITFFFLRFLCWPRRQTPLWASHLIILHIIPFPTWTRKERCRVFDL